MTGGRAPRRGAARRAAGARALAPAPKSPTKTRMKKKQKSITDGPAAALGAAPRGSKHVIEARGAYNATSKLYDFDGECVATNWLRIRPTLLATAPTASSKTPPTARDSAMPARPQVPTNAGPHRPIPLGWSKVKPPRKPWFRSSGAAQERPPTGHGKVRRMAGDRSCANLRPRKVRGTWPGLSARGRRDEGLKILSLHSARTQFEPAARAPRPPKWQPSHCDPEYGRLASPRLPG